jgi:uncharacterized protein (TIGR02284 family)
MQNEETVKAINTLITINNDRIDGYELAVGESEQLDFKRLFTENAATSKHCNVDLAKEVIKLGGTPSEGTKNLGKFFRVWMEMKTALTDNDRKTILNSCDFGEEKARETYSEILQNDAELLTPEQTEMIKSQRELLSKDHSKIIVLQNTILDNHSELDIMINK